MIRKTRNKLTFETLEDRTTPALFLNLDSMGNLFIGDGALQGNTSSGTVGIRYNAGQIEVYDGGNFGTATFLGTYTVTGDIIVNLNNFSASVVVDLNGTDIRNIGVYAGNGGNSVNFADYDGSGDSSGFIFGQLAVVTGTGSDRVKVGDPTGAVEIWGGISLNLGQGNDGFHLDWGSNVQGNVFLANVNGGVVPNPSLATPFALASATSLEFAVNAATTIEGSLIYSSTDEAQINDLTLGALGTIGGNLSIATNTGKAQQDTVLLQSDVNGVVAANLGNGINNFTLDAGAVIGRNLAYVGGTGNDVLVFNAGQVLGNISLTLAAGDVIGNSLTFNNGFVCNGTSIRIFGGNGVDSVIWDTTADASGAYFYMVLQAGNDTFTLNNATAFARAYVDFGFGTDTFIPPGGNPAFPFTTKNL